MTILKLVRQTNRDTIEALRRLMAAQQSLKGLIVWYRDDDGHEDAIFTGLYLSNPEKALKAALRMSMHLTQQEEAIRGKP